jgi:SAM-dependent methyltransferase
VSGWTAVLHPNDVERRRLELLGEMCDHTTFAHLRDLGVGEGWRCLEAGAGAGSVTRWLSRRVGDEGRVVATDVDTRFLSFPEAGNVEVVRHDLTVDPCPGRPFDLIHCRAVLMHLPEREAVLDRLVSWLRPGGWLLVEDGFILPRLFSPSDLARAFTAVADLMADRVGSDTEWALRLPGPLHARGLDRTGGAVHVPRTATPVLHHILLSLDQLRPALVAGGSFSGEELDRVAALLRSRDPSVITYGFGLVSAWGQRPP